MTRGFRFATIEDASLLLEWRNDIVTREASHNMDIITFEEHILWLKETLSNNQRQLYIYEEEGGCVGSVRVDNIEEQLCELSWTVSPHFRGKGIAKRMLKSLMEFIDCKTITAEVKVDNIVSQCVADSIGMNLIEEKNGILYYRN